MWSRCTDVSELVELLVLVEPNLVERNAILSCLKDTEIYRAYIYKTNVDGPVDAINISTKLCDGKVLHVEDFALHPRIRGKGLARGVWNSWKDYVANVEKWIETTDPPMTIEVYPHNVEPWSKIMGVKVVSSEPLPWTSEQIWWMSRNMSDELMKVVMKVWLEIQKLQMERMKFKN